MIYLIILTFVFFLIAFATKLLITYSLVKFFNKSKNFWLIFKPILLYELGVFCFFIIDPFSLIHLMVRHAVSPLFLFILYFLNSFIVLFFIFKIIMQKFSLLDFKKSLLVFFMMFLIVTPIISFSKGVIKYNIIERLPVYDEEFLFWEHFYSSRKQVSFSGVLLEKIIRLNDIFLSEKFLKELRRSLMTI